MVVLVAFWTWAWSLSLFLACFPWMNVFTPESSCWTRLGLISICKEKVQVDGVLFAIQILSHGHIYLWKLTSQAAKLSWWQPVFCCDEVLTSVPGEVQKAALNQFRPKREGAEGRLGRLMTSKSGRLMFWEIFHRYLRYFKMMSSESSFARQF